MDIRRIRVYSAAVAVALVLGGCGRDNSYVAPPLPKVTVAKAEKRSITPYLEATGNAAAVNSADLVARVAGFIETIHYQDGDTVKQGTLLFTIEREPYRVRLEQAKAAEVSAEAAYKQAQAAFERTSELLEKKVTTQALFDQALATREAARTTLDRARADTRLAAINYDYTEVKAPFDGVVSARKVSIGQYVGGTATPTVLATITQLDPIHVTFNISEQDVVRIRAERAERGEPPEDLKKIVVEAALQSDAGFPHTGHIDYVAPTISATTGTLAVRAIFDNPKAVLLPGYFVRVRAMRPYPQDVLLVPDRALGSDQGGRYLLVVNGDNVVEQRKVEIGHLIGELRVIETGLTPDDRVVVGGLLRAIPGQKVDPQTPAATTAAR